MNEGNKFCTLCGAQSSKDSFRPSKRRSKTWLIIISFILCTTIIAALFAVVPGLLKPALPDSLAKETGFAHYDIEIPKDPAQFSILLEECLYAFIDATQATEMCFSANPSEVDYYRWKEENNRTIALWEEVVVKSRALYLSLEKGVLGKFKEPVDKVKEVFGMGSADESVISADWTYEDVRKVYDSASPQQRLKTLAAYLGTDAKTAYRIHQMALNDADAANWSDFAKTAENLEKARRTVVTGSKVGVMVCSALLTGGATTMLEGTAMVIQGADLALEITETGAFVVMGDQSEDTTVVKYVQQARKLTEPAAAISGVLTLNFRNLRNLRGKTYYSDLDFDTAVQVLQMELTAASLTTDYIAEDKVLGIKINQDARKQDKTTVTKATIPSSDLGRYAFVSGINPTMFFDFPIQIRTWVTPYVPFKDFIVDYRKWITDGYQPTGPPRNTNELSPVPSISAMIEPAPASPNGGLESLVVGKWVYVGTASRYQGSEGFVDYKAFRNEKLYYRFLPNGTLIDSSGDEYDYFVERSDSYYLVKKTKRIHSMVFNANTSFILYSDGRLYLYIGGETNSVGGLRYEVFQKSIDTQ
jgi:hypothetical protein